MRRASALTLIVVGTLGMSATPTLAAAAPQLSAENLLKRLASPLAQLDPLPHRFRELMVSSYDRSGGNVDGGSYGAYVTATGVIPLSMVRRESGGAVLYEASRPGCVTRTFFANIGPPSGSVAAFGRLQIFIDGETEPRFDHEMTDFFAGNVAGYPHPLVGNWQTSSGGNYSYVPICFSRSVKVRTSKIPPDGLSWWEMNVLLAPRGTRVRPFNPRLDMSSAARRLHRAGRRPAATPDHRARAEIEPGDHLRVARLQGAGTVRYLRLSVEPFTAETLGSLRLVVRSRGRKPLIDVPLGAMFGDGIEVRELRSAGFGMDPAAGHGYLALPMPYRKGLRISVKAETRAKVRGAVWVRDQVVRGAGRLIGRHHVREPRRGFDTPILRAGGSGRLAAVVLEYLSGGPVSGINPLQRFLEGDERIQIDGSRSPIVHGTGHEEFSNGGFYFSEGAYSGLFGGAGPLGSTPGGAGTQSQYRVFADDAPRWSREIRHGHEHGGGDEQPVVAGVTTWSYRGRLAMRRRDRIRLGDEASRRRHGVRGATRPVELVHYFEGERDGNSTNSTIIVGGFYYGAPGNPAISPESFSATGVSFDRPLNLTLRTGRRNRGVVLRGLFDQGGPPVPLQVTVDGRDAGRWEHPRAIPNPTKRFLDDDFELRPALTRDRKRIRVTLTPAEPGASVDLYELASLARR